jgi:hypothetical protein
LTGERSVYPRRSSPLQRFAREYFPQDRVPECELLREVFGNPFRPLRPRAFPAHVVGLARECYDAFPEVSERFPILADALDDLGEGEAAEHCRRGGHDKGSHVLDWITGRR